MNFNYVFKVIWTFIIGKSLMISLNVGMNKIVKLIVTDEK